MDKIKEKISILLLLCVLPLPAFSETYLCVEDEIAVTGSTPENSVFKRISDQKFEMTIIGEELKIPLNVYFEDDEVIMSIIPAHLAKTVFLVVLLNKKERFYTAMGHSLTEAITEKLNIFEIFDSGKCQLL